MHEIFKSASKIAMLSVVFALIVLTGLGIEVTEPLKTVALMIIGYYFSSGKSQGQIETAKDADKN